MMRWLPVLLCLIAECSEPPSALPQTDDLNRPVPVTMTVSPVDGAELVRVPAATFVMGADDGLFAEAPAHRVRLPAFYIDRLEVTNARFARFVQASGRRPQGPWRRGFMPGGEDHPVRFVTWHDADAYCRWASRTLPTEAQWELAARGPGARRYPWGDVWRDGLARLAEDVVAGPGPAGALTDGAGPSGALDLTGNVWEWTADWYDRWYYRRLLGNIAVEPRGPPDGAPPEERFMTAGTAPGNERSTLKSIRGGGWSTPPVMARASRRLFGRPDAWFNDTGFRCAQEL